jgi:prepilin peptidase CpaA
MFADSTSNLVAGCVFTLVLLVACVSDLRTRRIPNTVVLTLLVLGAAYSTAALGLQAGISHVATGFAVGLLLWLPFWLLGWLGAGDVKLFAGGAAWLGAWGALQAAGVAAIAGAILSIVWLGWQRGVRVAFEKSFIAMVHPRVLTSASAAVNSRRRLVPYGVALAVGLLVVAWFPSLLPF